MKRFWLYACLFIGSVYATPDAPYYNSVSMYGKLTYTILVSFEATHPGCSSDAVLKYLRSKAFIHVQSDAQDMGYSWRRVLKSAYHIAISDTVEHRAILEALNKEMRYQLMWKRFLYWGALTGAAFSSAVSLVSVGCFLFYLNYDRKVVNHYRFQSLGGYFPVRF